MDKPPDKTAALIVVDVQRGFVTPDTRGVPAAVRRHIEASRGEYAVTIASRFENPEGSSFERLLGWAKMREPGDADLRDEVAGAVNVVVRKTGYSALTPQAADILASLGVTRVDVCGIDTDQCVLATLFALWDAGFEPRLIAGASGSAGGPDAHAAGLAAARRAIGPDRVVG